MIELPETYVLSGQINAALVGRTVTEAVANAAPHKFARYSGDPSEYSLRLAGKKITASYPGTGYTGGAVVEIVCGDYLLVIDSPIRYYPSGAKLPEKHQLLLRFNDGSHMSSTVQMWGSMYCYPLPETGLPNTYKTRRVPTPLSDEFDDKYFLTIMAGCGSLSVKAFLATGQRIPGLGNGVLQDILFNAKIHPKRRIISLTRAERAVLYSSVKKTLAAMTAKGGRNTEKDLYGCKGGYKVILSSKAAGAPCPRCGSMIERESYMGGNIYFCPSCQPV